MSILRVLKNSLVTRFIGPFSYENLSGQGTFSTSFPSCTSLVSPQDEIHLLEFRNGLGHLLTRVTRIETCLSCQNEMHPKQSQVVDPVEAIC
jgi:hypothetical protein